MSKKVWIGVGIAVIVTALLSAAMRWGGNRQPSTIPIGVVLPLTGEGAQYGKSLQRGATLAMKQINAGGGISGKPIRLIFEDSKADPKVAVAGFGKLVDVNKVAMVIGDMFSAPTLAVGPLAQARGVVLLSPTSSSPQVPATGDHVFTIYPSAVDDGRFLGTLVTDRLRPKKVAVLYVQADAMIACKKAFARRMRARGVSVVTDEGFAPGTTDFKAVLSRLAAEAPEVTFLSAYLPEVSRLLVQARQKGLSTRFVTISTAYDDQLFELAGNASQGVLLSAPFFEDRSAHQPIPRFVRDYSAEFGHRPNVWAAYGYDAVVIAVTALKMQSKGTMPLNTALQSVEHVPSVTGFMSFNRDRTVDAKLRILEASGGKFHEFATP